MEPKGCFGAGPDVKCVWIGANKFRRKADSDGVGLEQKRVDTG